MLAARTLALREGRVYDKRIEGCRMVINRVNEAPRRYRPSMLLLSASSLLHESDGLEGRVTAWSTLFIVATSIVVILF